MLLHFKKLATKKKRKEKLCLTKNIHAKLQTYMGKLSSRTARKILSKYLKPI